MIQEQWNTEEWQKFKHGMAQALPTYSPGEDTSHLHPLAGKCVRSALIFQLQSFWPHPRAPFLAAAIECLHTASLFHDDVLDHSLWRRGSPSAQCLWGTKNAILMGDWWLTQALNVLNQCESREINDKVHRGLHMMVIGQCHEVRSHDPAWPLWRYVVMMGRKTGLLFALAAQCAAVLGQASPQAQQALYGAGLSMGMAYQLADDGKEYQIPVQNWDIGHDWIQGKMTFPCRVAYGFWSSSQWQTFWQWQNRLAQAMSLWQKHPTIKQKNSAVFAPALSNEAMDKNRLSVTLGDVLTPSSREKMEDMVRDLAPGVQATFALQERYVKRGLMAWQKATLGPPSSVIRRLFFGHFGQF